jgi:hypothetical protein
VSWSAPNALLERVIKLQTEMTNKELFIRDLQKTVRKDTHVVHRVITQIETNADAYETMLAEKIGAIQKEKDAEHEHMKQELEELRQLQSLDASQNSDTAATLVRHITCAC